MGDCFHNAEVDAESIFEQLLAVPCNGGGGKRQIGILPPKFEQIVEHNRYGIAGVAAVDGIEHFLVFSHYDSFDCCRSGVNAEIRLSLVGSKIAARSPAGGVALLESFIFLFVFKERRNKAEGCVGVIAFYVLKRFVNIDGLHAAVRCTESDKVKRILGADTGCFQSNIKCAAQLRKEGQRTAEVQYLAGDFAALCEACNGLVRDGGEDACANVAFACALIEKRLNVAFGEHAAARSDGVDFLVLRSQRVHFIERQIQKRCHLIDEGSRAAGAGAVHAHLHPAGEEEDLCVLSAELDDHIRVGDPLVGGNARCINFLDKRQIAGLCDAHTGRAGDGELCRLAAEDGGLDFSEKLRHFLRNLREMTLVGLINDLLAVVEDHTFDGSRAYVKANFHLFFLPFRFTPRNVSGEPAIGCLRMAPG